MHSLRKRYYGTLFELIVENVHTADKSASVLTELGSKSDSSVESDSLKIESIKMAATEYSES